MKVNSQDFKKWREREIFLKIHVPPDAPFFLRLDGWRFQRLSEKLKAEKPFDKRFTECLISASKKLFTEGFNPTLVYISSDELNILFLNTKFFGGKVEKIDSISAGFISSAFTLSLAKTFKKECIAAFDSRIVITQTDEMILKYLCWRQLNTWRNHNNAYAYWIFRKIGLKPSEIAEKLKGMKTKELHEEMFKHGLNLTQTPQWQRRGILLYKEPFTKHFGNQLVVRWTIRENWKLPLFTSEDGEKLIQKILKWKRKEERIVGKREN
ncbi:tRNA 5'-guanylyltransferase [Candidatus Bathyarchaeota archaeon]|nr:tRNA 5'-guanylyltransferase [Candidatus Bathyarchaeota archaeon]